MFETMSTNLPAYEEYVDRLSALAQQHGTDLSKRLVKAMGYIYTDLIQFCFDVYRLLSKKRKGETHLAQLASGTY